MRQGLSQTALHSSPHASHIKSQSVGCKWQKGTEMLFWLTSFLDLKMFEHLPFSSVFGYLRQTLQFGASSSPSTHHMLIVLPSPGQMWTGQMWTGQMCVTKKERGRLSVSVFQTFHFSCHPLPTMPHFFSTFACNLKKRPRCIQMHASFRWEHLLVYCLAVIGESFLPGCHFENRRGEVVLCWGHIDSIVSLQVNVLYMINVQISHI